MAELKIFNSNPANFTGMPKTPGYLGKNKLQTITYPVEMLGTKFPTIEKRELYMDFSQDTQLSKNDNSIISFDYFIVGERKDTKIEVVQLKK